jgi:hypothetical protein
MDPLVHQTRFEHFPFVWDNIFADRRTGRTRFYVVESRIAVEEGSNFGTSTPLTTQIVVDRFLDYGCAGDRERYIYRNMQIECLLRGLNLDGLCHGSIPDVNAPLVLLDDRHVLGGPPAAVLGNHESFRRVLSAHEFYKSLRDSVCSIIPYPGYFTKQVSVLILAEIAENFGQIADQCRLPYWPKKPFN